jgi:hypothetical protein
LGLFDIATPLLDWLDHAVAAVVPTAGRLVVWGLLAGALSMSLYALLSPQSRLQRVKEQALEARRALDLHDGSLAEARPLIRRAIGCSMKQLGLVFLPAVVASFPLLFLLVWLHGSFTYVAPAEPEQIAVRTEPPGYDAELVVKEPGSAVEEPGKEGYYLVVRDGRERVLEERRLEAPVTVLHKKQWWNLLVANPLGYLAESSPLDQVSIDLPRREVLDFGPQWLRTWEFVFLTSLVAVSLLIKTGFRLV